MFHKQIINSKKENVNNKVKMMKTSDTFVLNAHSIKIITLLIKNHCDAKKHLIIKGQ